MDNLITLVEEINLTEGKIKASDLIKDLNILKSRNDTNYNVIVYLDDKPIDQKSYSPTYIPDTNLYRSPGRSNHIELYDLDLPANERHRYENIVYLKFQYKDLKNTDQNKLIFEETIKDKKTNKDKKYKVELTVEHMDQTDSYDIENFNINPRRSWHYWDI